MNYPQRQPQLLSLYYYIIGNKKRTMGRGGSRHSTLRPLRFIYLFNIYLRGAPSSFAYVFRESRALMRKNSGVSITVHCFINFDRGGI